jgi:WhiB family transcriptional regulator, redox-sensing transcriptional regulator
MAEAAMAANVWDIGWQYEAACRGEDSELFFAPNYFERKEEKEAREAKAKAICVRCPVRTDCLEYALRNREPHGIWGALNEIERKALIRERERSARRAG